MPQDEDALLDALARLHAAGAARIGDGGPGYVGAFRAHGLLVPVWDLAPDADGGRRRGTGRGVRRAARRGAGRDRAAHRRRAPGPRRRGQPPGHPALRPRRVVRRPGATGDPGPDKSGQSGSRAIGQDMHLGPPRPDPSSLPLIATTSMPAASSRALVWVLRS